MGCQRNLKISDLEIAQKKRKSHLVVINIRISLFSFEGQSRFGAQATKSTTGGDRAKTTIL